MATNDTLQAIGDEPERMRGKQDWITSAAFSPSPSPTLQYEPQPDKCSVHFSTNTASARRLKAQEEELAYLQAIQHGNKAVMESLVQFVGAELGDQRYEDVIKENIIGIQEDQKNCHGVVEKAEDDLEKQLEGEVSGALTGMQKWVKSVFQQVKMNVFVLSSIKVETYREQLRKDQSMCVVCWKREQINGGHTETADIVSEDVLKW